LRAFGAGGVAVAAADPWEAAGASLRGGGIIAVKSLGGFHLVCMAGDERAVAELRRRKHRDEKPFALMVGDLAGARQIAEVSPAEECPLTSPHRPIVLLRRRADAGVAAGVAPRNSYLGVMLPYTPLHHLLLHALDSMPLVMTSGNRSDEPIAYDDTDAVARLSGIADLFLTHDRPIHIRCDDSVTRVAGGCELPLRRSRGQAPQPLGLPVPCRRPALALGGQSKVTFALARGRHAFLSHHIGDLDHYEAFRAYTLAIAHYERLLAIEPELVAHDLHPDYASTRYALERTPSVPLLPVQHHHAHMASCMAEHGLDEPVIGVVFDGTGYGSDGAVWGGEFLTGDCRAFRRVAHLRYVAMPGGEQAIRQPWRMAAAHLADAGQDAAPFFGHVSATALAAVDRQIERRFNAPSTSSVGRLFDAVASLAGVRQCVSFDGQAAIELESLAADVADGGVYPFEIVTVRQGDPPASTLVIDTRPLIAAVSAQARRVDAALVGRRFQSTLVEIIAQVCARLARETGLATVVCSGGVFSNALLSVETAARLTKDGFRVYRHYRVPPGDGGLCLGQLAVAAAWQMSRSIPE